MTQLAEEEELKLLQEPQKVTTIFERLAALAASCAYIRKDGINQFHKYSYATAAQIFERVGEGLSTVGLVSVPRFSIEESGTRTNAKGATESLVTVRCDLDLWDESGSRKITATAFGCGMDSGDKAPMKAQTAALKYAWMTLLNISTGDDPEGDHSVDTRMEGKPLPKEPARGATERREGSGPLTETANQAIISLPDDGDPGYDPEPDFTKAFQDYNAGIVPGTGLQETCPCGASVSPKTSKSGTFYSCDTYYKAIYKGDKQAEAELTAKGFTGKHTYMKGKEAK